MKAQDCTTARDWLLLYEVSTRMVIGLPSEIKMTIGEFRELIMSVAGFFRDYRDKDTDDYYLLSSPYIRDFKKYAGFASSHVLKMIGKKRIFIVRRKVTE
jgi:hypothetical protein